MITIRPCTKNDTALIVALGIQTFQETFGAVNSAENMDLYLKSNFSFEKVKKEFDEKGAVFFLAESAGQPAGFAKVRASNKETGLDGYTALEIERIYAVKKFIGTGVGKLLMETCVTHAENNAYDLLWLGVWEHNTRALAFYSNWGFEKFGQHVFILGNDAQTDILMKKNI